MSLRTPLVFILLSTLHILQRNWALLPQILLKAINTDLQILREYHAFWSVLRHSRISYQMSRNSTILSSYPSITYAILFHRWMMGRQRDWRRFSYLVSDYFWVKNVKSIQYWHQKKAISCNLVTSKIERMVGQWWDRIFIPFTRIWMAKFWQVC